MARVRRTFRRNPGRVGAARTARLFFAAADPVRIRILGLLAKRQDACVTDIASALGMSVAAVSHHLQRLRASGCLKAY